jgi:hypothetical protein
MSFAAAGLTSELLKRARWIVYSDKLAATGKYSKETLDEYDKFQHGMLIRTGILLGLMIIIMITLASVRPTVTGPFFLIPMGVMALSLLVYAVMWFAAYWKLNRLFAADRKRRGLGLPLDLPESVIDDSNHDAGPALRQ